MAQLNDYNSGDLTLDKDADGNTFNFAGDLTLEKDADRKTLKKDLYDLKLRIYYMEQREKILNGEAGDDIYQKYMDLQSEFEKLSKNLDEKDDLLLKAEKVTTYLREEKTKLGVEFLEKEKFYKEYIQQLEKELENMRLCNPKFGLHSTVFMSGDSVDSYSVPASSDQKRINSLEFQIHQLNLELESMKTDNDQLEKSIHSLQRKIQLSNKEISDLNDELLSVQKERDLAVENCAKNNELLSRLESEKEKLEAMMTKTRDDSMKMHFATNSHLEQTPLREPPYPVESNAKTEEAAAALIRHLLAENKRMNVKLRKVKDELLLIKELCSSCSTCAVQEMKQQKKSSAGTNLRQRPGAAVSSTSEDDKNDMPRYSDSENESLTSGAANPTETGELRKSLREKDRIIRQLRAENKKRTFNLQELVNKELWDKNREIEKLNKQCEKLKYEIELLSKQASHGAALPMRELQSYVRYANEGKENVAGVSDDVKLLKEQLRNCLEEKRALLQRINALECRAAGDEEQKAQTALVRNLRLECAKHRDDFDEAEKARKDAFNACALLINRLEELASFLESLLAHDASALNARRRELLRQAIERSREISKSFSCTFVDPDTASVAATKFESSVDLSYPILPDYSEINLSFSCDDEEEGDDADFGAPHQKESGDPAAADKTLKADSTNDEVDRSQESVDDSDAYNNGGVRKNIFSSQELNARSELMLCSQHLCPADEDTADTAGTEMTDDSQRMPRRSYCKACCTGDYPNSTLTSSVPSSDEALKRGHADSLSVTAAGAGRLSLGSGTKMRTRKLRPEPCYTTDSDVSGSYDKKFEESNEMRFMRRRIRTLQRINDALRLNLKQGQPSEGRSNMTEKTDVEKICDKTKLRNLLNKINLENCVDSEKYRDCVEKVRKSLRQLSKHVKSKKLDKSFVWTKLQEVREHFDLSELCCAKLNEHLGEARVRNEMLSNMLDETQSKFEQVMADLRTTKLAYNGVLLEHEQNVYKYETGEADNQKLRQKLDSAEEVLGHVECDLQKATDENRALQTQLRAAASLKEQLEAAAARVQELESFVAANDQTRQELETCRTNLVRLSAHNEELLRHLDEVSAYKGRIEEYESRLESYKKTCERLEQQLFEKDTIERLYEEQRRQLEEQVAQKNAISDTLKRTDSELTETRARIEALEAQISELGAHVSETENAISAKEAQIVDLQREKERGAQLLEEMKRQTEGEIREKSEMTLGLRNLLAASDEKTQKLEREMATLRSLLSTCEEEKRDFREKIQRQWEEHESLKKQHEQKMKYLLAQIVAYRTEEESSLTAHRQLVEQIEEAQRKKETWKRSIQEWRDKYDELRAEKERIERQLQAGECKIGCVPSIDSEVDHLESVKSQLESRVRELEMANEEMEARLQRLQSHRSCGSDFDDDPTSDDCAHPVPLGAAAARRSPASKGAANPGVGGAAAAATYVPPASPRSPAAGKDEFGAGASGSSTSSSPLGAGKTYSSSLRIHSSKDSGVYPRAAGLSINASSVNESSKLSPSRKDSSEHCATSPDLGIDSDPGRKNSFDFDKNLSYNKTSSEIGKLEEENRSLKRELGRTRQELEETLEKLTALNKNKEKMEKAIFEQIYETKHILHRARVNLEDENVNSAPR